MSTTDARQAGPRRARSALALVLTLLLGACGSGGDGAERAEEGLSAQVASYDLAVGGPQRFLVGLLTPDQRLVAYGEARLSFAFAGTREAPVEPRPGPEVAATFRPVAGQPAPPADAGPTAVEPSATVGVYATDDARFDRPGFWQVTAAVRLGGKERTATAPFEVLERHRVPAPGDPAPRTENRRPGDPGAPATAVDSRAEDGSVPDPELHSTTVADALAAGRPAMVVVSTPVYCVSRFCGPITDAVAAVARRHGERMAFVHLEVWRDFEDKVVNEAAAEWVYRPGAADLNEPWVFVVGPDGRIVERFDNVVTDAELEAAAVAVLE